jgi:hypothetical protein
MDYETNCVLVVPLRRKPSGSTNVPIVAKEIFIGG